MLDKILCLLYNSFSLKKEEAMYCVICSDDVNPKRILLGYKTCMVCGEKNARNHKHTIVNLHKSNYVPITDLNLLKGINSKYANS